MSSFSSSTLIRRMFFDASDKISAFVLIRADTPWTAPANGEKADKMAARMMNREAGVLMIWQKDRWLPPALEAFMGAVRSAAREGAFN